MVVIDTHCHASPVFYEPIECLLFQMDRCGVERAVLIQMREQYDNEYLFACQRHHPERLAAVVLVDHARAAATGELERLAERGAVGLRLAADARSPGHDPYAIWRAAEQLQLVVSCQPSGEALASDAFRDLVTTVPALRIVVEHLGGQHRLTPRGQSVERASGSRLDNPGLERVLALARFPNVYVKVPGLGEFCERAMPVTDPFPFLEPIPPILDQFYDAFGADRLMWGSDYPPVSTREGYANALRFPREYFASRPRQAQEQIFGGTAASVFTFAS